jgi:hypothetical protein
MANDDKALSFVGQIIAAYNAAEKAGASALNHALECGKYLSLAFENVETATGKGKWKKWREANLRTVSEETERVYRRLADAVAKKPDIFAKCKSIRDAIKRRSEFDENLDPKPERKRVTSKKAGSGSTAAGLDAPETDTPSTGLKAELENAAADEIIANLEGDALEEVAARSVAKLTPEKVCEVLKEAWAEDQLRDLRSRLNTYLSELHSAPQDTSTAPTRPRLEMPGFERRI